MTAAAHAEGVFGVFKKMCSASPVSPQGPLALIVVRSLGSLHWVKRPALDCRSSPRSDRPKGSCTLASSRTTVWTPTRTTTARAYGLTPLPAHATVKLSLYVQS